MNLHPVFRIWMLVYMGTAALGIGIKIIYHISFYAWGVVNYLDGITLFILGVFAYIQALKQLEMLKNEP